jgi:hypothetical protein
MFPLLPGIGFGELAEEPEGEDVDWGITMEAAGEEGDGSHAAPAASAGPATSPPKGEHCKCSDGSVCCWEYGARVTARPVSLVFPFSPDNAAPLRFKGSVYCFEYGARV